MGSVIVKQPCVYLLASDRNGTLYWGVTSDLAKRVWRHKGDLVDGLTRRYRVHTLVCSSSMPLEPRPFIARRQSRSGSGNGSSP
jgi:putative endonuclease